MENLPRTKYLWIYGYFYSVVSVCHDVEFDYKTGSRIDLQTQTPAAFLISWMTLTSDLFTSGSMHGAQLPCAVVSPATLMLIAQVAFLLQHGQTTAGVGNSRSAIVSWFSGSALVCRSVKLLYVEPG